MALAHAIVGDAWTQLILREAFYGVRRFTEWSDSLAIPRTVLSGRLKRLCEAGILETRVPERAVRSEYRLTDMGRDLYGVALIQGMWERNYSPSRIQRRYALSFHNVRTGRAILPGVLDRIGGQQIARQDVAFVAGANLTERLPPMSRRISPRTLTGRPIIERSVDIIGDNWSWSVVACAFLRIRRFDDISDATGMAPNVLSDRLGRLTEAGILKKVPYGKGGRRYEYRLDTAGLGLHPLVMAMFGWAERWLCDFDDPPMKLFHRSTGERITPVVCDLLTGEAIEARHTRWRLESHLTSRPPGMAQPVA